MIRLNKLSKSFSIVDGSITVFTNLSLEIPTGTVATIVGASGCGKSTLIRLIAGLEKADSGSIELGQDDSPKSRPNFSVAFQDHGLLEWRTVTQNINLPHEIGPLRAATGNTSRNEEISNLIRLMGLEGFDSAFPDQLSGGMKSRVSLARALIEMRQSSCWMNLSGHSMK